MFGKLKLLNCSIMINLKKLQTGKENLTDT